jgi:hypothetical protein
MIGAGVVLALAIALYARSDAYCRIDRNCGQLLRLEQVVLLYLLETGVLPSELSQLLKPEPGRWEPPGSLNESDLIDQWGHAIVYRREPRALSFALLIPRADSQPDRLGPPHDVVREWKP